MGGIVLFYKENNGTKDEDGTITTIPTNNKNTALAAAKAAVEAGVYGYEKFKSFGLGSNDYVDVKKADGTTESKNNLINSTNGTSYTIVASITGFPTSFAVYNNNYANGAWGVGASYTDWQVDKLKVGTDKDNLTTLWEGACKTSNCNETYPSRYIVNMDGTADVWYPNTLSFRTGVTTNLSNNYVYASVCNGGDADAELFVNPGTGTGFDQVKNATADNTIIYRRAWAAPKPDTISGLTYSDFTASSSATSTTATPSFKDQYGVDIIAPSLSLAYSVADYNYVGENQTLISGTPDCQVDSSTGAVSAAAGGYTAHGYANHILTAGIAASLNDATTSFTKDINITYPSYTVNWNYNTSTTASTTGVPTTLQGSVLYGDIPVMPSMPSNYDSYYDSEQHHSGGSFNPVRATSNVDVNMTYSTNEDHTLTETISSEPSCTVPGSKDVECSNCDYEATVNIPKLDHNMQKQVVTPINGRAGQVYFECIRNGCGKCQVAEYDSTIGDYVNIDDAAHTYDTLQELRNSGNILEVASPLFNDYEETEDFYYDYSNRGAALKLGDPYEYSTPDTRQAMRFTAAMQIPAGVDYRCGNTDPTVVDTNNIVKDFGFVYTQLGKLPHESASDLYIGAPECFKMSVRDNNMDKGHLPAFDGSNWTGVTLHSFDGINVLTFNLVIKIKAYNWCEDYCARAFITYNYNGFEYTVYDNDMSLNSVEFIAQQVVDDAGASEFAQNYCQNKILTPIEEGLPWPN